MQLIDSPDTSSYSFILTETEWYLATEQEQAAWTVQIQREALAAGRRYCNILVDPDAVMSIAALNKRHTVWRTSFMIPLEDGPKPVAWRVKDFADGWILCHSEAQAKREAEGAGNLIQPLYLADAFK